MADDDYMSSAFLNVKGDIRPGLTHSKSTKRKYEIEKTRFESNKVHRTKPRWQLEEESRNTGLSIALGAGNKGFAILEKMGYKPGMKLGPQKSTDVDSGLMEPIKVTVKKDRGGLGRDDEIRKRIEQKEERRHKMKVYKEQETAALTEQFRERMKNNRMNKRLFSDLAKCQKTCEQLDAELGIEEPMRPWFWYSNQIQEEDDEEEESNEEAVEDFSVEEKIEFITEYIRPKYFYCFWCSVRYDGEEDMAGNCPGPDKDSHDDLDF